MRIERQQGVVARQIESADIPVGTVFYGRVGEHEETLLLKAYQSVVSLEDPKKTWGMWAAVSGYRPVRAKVVVEGDLSDE